MLDFAGYAVDVHQQCGADVERPVDAGRGDNRLDRERIAHLDRRGKIPLEMIADTAAPASSVDGNVPKIVRVACGLRRMRTTTSVTMPRSPSLPTNTPIKS